LRNLWDKKFEAAKDAITPEDIVSAQCRYLEDMTHGSIIARVSSYYGDIPSFYNESGSRDTAMKLKLLYTEIHAEKQDGLRGAPDDGFTFEFFITSVSTPNYKYRVFFIRYGIPFYPVSIILDEAIASELGFEQSFNCDSQEIFESILSQILGSKKVESVISALLAIAVKSGDHPGF